MDQTVPVLGSVTGWDVKLKAPVIISSVITVIFNKAGDVVSQPVSGHAQVCQDVGVSGSSVWG